MTILTFFVLAGTPVVTLLLIAIVLVTFDKDNYRRLTIRSVNYFSDLSKPMHYGRGYSAMIGFCQFIRWHGEYAIHAI